MFDVLLKHNGIVLADQTLAGTVLPRLLAALLREHLDEHASRYAPSDRVRLQARMSGCAELHRTQIWRALRRLEGSPLRGLVQALHPSSGPFWLDEAHLARCRFRVLGQPADRARLDAFLDPPSPGRGARSAAPALQQPDVRYVEALSRADYLLDRGELYPARQTLLEAEAWIAGGDILSRALLSIRRARIARRLAAWADLQEELRELGRHVGDATLPVAMRMNLRARLCLLSAWHLFGSLGNVQAALAELEQMEDGWLGADWSMRAEYCNLRGLVVRDIALAGRNAPKAREALDCLGEAVRFASLDGRPDGLQSVTANLANSLAQLHEAGLLGQDGPAGILPALRWLLLSESICRRWQIGKHSLLNMVFLLRMAADSKLSLPRLKENFPEYDDILNGESFAQIAGDAWNNSRNVLSQIPADQRCAFMLVWACHAGEENDRVRALDLCAQVLLQSRKLRDAGARLCYAGAVRELRAKLVGER